MNTLFLILATMPITPPFPYFGVTPAGRRTPILTSAQYFDWYSKPRPRLRATVLCSLFFISLAEDYKCKLFDDKRQMIQDMIENQELKVFSIAGDCKLVDECKDNTCYQKITNLQLTEINGWYAGKSIEFNWGMGRASGLVGLLAPGAGEWIDEKKFSSHILLYTSSCIILSIVQKSMWRFR